MFRLAGQIEHQFVCVSMQGATFSIRGTSLATDFSWSPTTGDRHSCAGRQEPMRAARASACVAGIVAPDGKICCGSRQEPLQRGGRIRWAFGGVYHVQIVGVDLGTWSKVSEGESQRVCRGSGGRQVRQSVERAVPGANGTRARALKHDAEDPRFIPPHRKSSFERHGAC